MVGARILGNVWGACFVLAYIRFIPGPTYDNLNLLGVILSTKTGVSPGCYLVQPNKNDPEYYNSCPELNLKEKSQSTNQVMVNESS